MCKLFNEITNSFEGAQVGTVGRIKAAPGAPNVIPGKVIASLEIRDLSSKVIQNVFNAIKNNYLEAIEIAKKATKQPTILSGAIMSKDIWNLPAGESFVAQYLKDANLDYLWKNTKGKGSLSLSFESILDKGKEADFWIAPGYFTSKEQMLNSNKHYAEFKAFKNDKIYSPALKKGKTGGVLYFELAPTRPDLVLKDVIKITHPELLPNYKLTFFEKIK